MKIGLVYNPNRDVSILVQIPHLKKLREHRDYESDNLLAFYLNLVVLCENQPKDKGVYITMDELAEDMGMSRRSVLRWKKILIELGLITTKRKRYGLEWNIMSVENQDVTQDATQDVTPDVTREYPIEIEQSPKNGVGTGETNVVGQNQDVTCRIIRNYNRDVQETSSLKETSMHLEETSIHTTPNIHNAPSMHQETSILNTMDSFIAEKTRKSDQAPKLPVKVSETLDIGHIFPYLKTGLHVSALWYWAVRRYQLYGIDTYFTKDGFKKQITIFTRNVVSKLGKDWKKIKKYVDWYVTSEDKFIAKECDWGMQYMSSTHCVNKYLADFREIRKMMITTDEERRTAGRWIKS